jgi:hypothetical protein
VFVSSSVIPVTILLQSSEKDVNEMVDDIVLGIRLSPNSFQRVTVGNISLDSKVEHLKAEVSRTTNLPRHFIGKCRETELNCMYLHCVKLGRYSSLADSGHGV